MSALKKLVIRYLKEVTKKIEEESCELTDEEAMDILKVIAHESLSKEQACIFLNMSRSNFDLYIRQKKLPKGRKIAGYNELRWYKDELELYNYKLND